MKSTKLSIYGKQPVLEVLENAPETIYQLYIRETGKGGFFEDIWKEAKQQKIPIHKIPEKRIKDLVGDVNDQGVVAELKEYHYADFHECMSEIDIERNPAVVLLDEVEDPHNVGAIIRSAAALGVSAVLLPTHRQAGVTATVFKTSAGAVMHIPVIKIGNVNQTINELKKKGFWIAGLAGDEENAQDLMTTHFDSPTVIVVGGEGKGIREKTRELCDFLLRIPLREDVESLNASVAAAIACYEWKRQQN